MIFQLTLFISENGFPNTYRAHVSSFTIVFSHGVVAVRKNVCVDTRILIFFFFFPAELVGLGSNLSEFRAFAALKQLQPRL